MASMPRPSTTKRANARTSTAVPAAGGSREPGYQRAVISCQVGGGPGSGVAAGPRMASSSRAR